MADIPNNSNDIDSISKNSLTILNEPTVEEVDRVFIRKTIEFINTLPGADKDSILVQTNTSFPSRYVLKICNLPNMTLNDFESIKTLAPRLRCITMSLKENWLKIDMWKNGATSRKIKRKLSLNTKRTWNLKSIGSQDHGMLKRLLDGFSNLPSLPCQFHVDVVNDPPNYYYLDIVSNDIVNEKEVGEFKHTFRAFVKKVVFNFPVGSIKVTVEKASASTEAAVGKRRHVVFKRSN